MEKSNYIYAGWLIDGSGEGIQERILLQEKDGIIIDLVACPKDQVPAECIDLSHCTILPPLIDSHLHLAMSGSIDRRFREQQLHADYTTLKPLISHHLSYLLSHGILAVRDGGDKNGYVVRYRDNDKQEKEAVIIIKTVGRAWHKKGRYGGLIGRCPDVDVTLSAAFEKKPEKQDHVKLVNSGLNSLLQFGLETKPQFSQQEIHELVVHAETKGKKIMVHANGREPVHMSIEAGCTSIEHGFFMGEENLRRMAELGVFWVPTAYTMKAYAENLGKGEQASKEIAMKNLKHQIGQIGLAHALGVTLALGTDSGSMGVLHGESLVEEMKLYIKAGLSLSETVKCATYNGARLLGVEDKMGLLQKGRPATFIVTRGTPAQLPRKLSYLEYIFIDGRIYEGYRKNPIKVLSSQ